MTINMIKFTDDFVKEWNGRKLNVNGANINFDGRYGIQCMDLWNYFWTELGIPAAGFPRHADAAAVWENSTGNHYHYFDGITPDKPAKPGDVFIYNRKAWGTGFGHIGIVIRDNGNGTITVLECNGLGDGYEDQWMNQYGSPPRIHTWPKTNLYGYLRRIGAVYPTTTQKVPAGRYWIVERGDSLSKIAAYYKTSVATLLKLNPSIKDANKIAVGQYIDAPG